MTSRIGQNPPGSSHRRWLPRSGTRQRFVWPHAAGAALLAGAGLIAYHGMLSAPFIFDDMPGIVENSSIRHGLMFASFTPAGVSGASGRPLVNLSLAFNYSLGGLDPRGYHLFNLIVHLAAACLLWGIAWRTLARCGIDRAGPVALTIALLWTVHPLLTESVTCIIQRTESLMGLFYLLTLYCYIRYADDSDETLARSATRTAGGIERSGTRQRFVNIWAAGSIAFCLLGMATKEAMVTAPVLVFLYDRTFLAGSFAAAWRRRRAYYCGLAATWLLLGALLVRSGGSRGEAAGFGFGVTPGSYLVASAWAIIHYLRLALWPVPLILDYGTFLPPLAHVWPQGLLVLALLAGTIWLLGQPAAHPGRRALGFAGAWFFLILAPSSSVVPLVTQTVAEHRMYLPLAVVIAVVVAGVWRRFHWTGLALCLAAAAALAARTVERNRDYRSALAIWSDTVAHWPGSGRAHAGWGLALAAEGKLPEAIDRYRTGLRLNPGDPDIECDLGCAYYQQGKLPEAVAAFHRALERRPGFAEAYLNLGGALLAAGDSTGAIAAYRTAIALDLDLAEAHYNLGIAFARIGRPAEAIAENRSALDSNPRYAEAAYNLGIVLDSTGRREDAIASFRRALQLRPDYPEAENNLGNALRSSNRSAEAVPHFQRASALQPDSSDFHFNLANTLVDLGRWSDAAVQYDEAARLKRDIPVARLNFGVALAKAGRLEQAAEQFRHAIALQPNSAQAHELLGRVLQAQGRKPEAAVELADAARLRKEGSR